MEDHLRQWPPTRRYSAPGATRDAPGFYADVGSDWGAPDPLPALSPPQPTFAQLAAAHNWMLAWRLEQRRVLYYHYYYLPPS